MKKGVLVCAAVLVLAVLVAAPASAASKKVDFGFKLGLSSSNNKWTDDDGTENALTEATYGGLAIINLSPNIGLQVEIDYLITGETWPSVEYDTVKERFGYLHIPVLFRYKFMKEGKFIPVAFAGPVISFLVSAYETGYGDVEDFFKSTDFGLDMGLGAEFALGNIKALIDFRYYMGLTNVYSAPDFVIMAVPMDFTMKNAAFMLTVGIIL